MPADALPSAVEQSIEISPSIGSVSSLLLRPRSAQVIFLIAHGAGAGMCHEFLEVLAHALFGRDVATLRYQFPYMEAGRKFPDRQPAPLQTVKSAASFARAVAPDLTLIAGGKSMGGLMTTLAAAQSLIDDVAGLVLIGFPLHPAGKPSTDRADHLSEVDNPMLFLQGTWDNLADIQLMQQVESVFAERADFHYVESADHMFKVLKKLGRSHDEIMEELSEVIARWAMNLPNRT